VGKFIDLTDQRFGKWRVLHRDDQRPALVAYWVCRCKCGKTASVRGQYLRDGRSTQCVKCADKQRGSETKYAVGDRVGRWTILGYDSVKKRYRCQCACGTRGLRQATNLATGYRLAEENTGCRRCNLPRAVRRMWAKNAPPAQ
jgi:hypothetical protein